MSKGGSTTSSTEIPAWLENAAIENINKGRDVSEIGYTPYYGPEVAAFSPMQQQSMQSTGGAASAFGLAPQGFDAMAGMPEAQTFAGGIQGYSSAPLYEEALSQLQQNRPGQYNAINNMFIDPYSGADAGNYAASPEQVAQMFDRTPTNQPDYSINIDNSAVGGTGGTASGGAGGGSAYDAIYHQAGSGDMTSGDTFVGDNGNTYTVGYGEGQVDHGLANAAADNNGYNGLMSNTDAAAGIAGNLLDSTIYGQIYEGITDKPLAGGSPDAPVSELSNADVADSRFNGINGYNDYNPNTGGGINDRVMPLITPYPESNITGGPDASYDLMSNVSAPAPAPVSVDAEYDLQTRLRDEEIRNEKAAAAKVISDRVAATKARYAKEKAAAAQAKKSATDRAAEQLQAQLAAEEKAAKVALDKAVMKRENEKRAKAKAVAAKKKADAAAAKKTADAIAAKNNRGNNKSTPTKATKGQVRDSAGNVVKSGNGNAVKIAIPKSGGGGGGGGGGGSSAGGSGGGTYCCTKMRENGKWTSNRRVYKMHKWHFEQPQWWRDGYNVWGKVIADNLLSKDGEFSASVMNDFYEHRVNGGKFTPKAALAHVAMYPAIFAIGMVAKVTGKHITSVTITS